MPEAGFLPAARVQLFLVPDPGDLLARYRKATNRPVRVSIHAAPVLAVPRDFTVRVMVAAIDPVQRTKKPTGCERNLGNLPVGQS